jgi:catechol 2,3-dioxygenase
VSRGPGGVAPGYRLPDGAHPGRVVLQVADLERSLGYYERVLGLSVLGRSSGSALLGAGGDGSPLVELREQPGAAPVPPRGRTGLYHFALLLPDRAALGRFLRHLEGAGVRAGAADHRVSEALYLSDPDGLGIEVYADRPRDAWAYRAGELVMATEPLDLDDLARAAGSVPWQGVPAGSRIGHVHLHVGDLRRATEFYHAALGLDRVVWSYPGALFLSAGGYHHHLGVNTWAAGAGGAGPGDARLLEWRLVLPAVEDVDAAARSLEDHGHGVERGGDGGVLARDPWGTALRLVTGEG